MKDSPESFNIYILHIICRINSMIYGVKDFDILTSRFPTEFPTTLIKKNLKLLLTVLGAGVIPGEDGRGIGGVRSEGMVCSCDQHSCQCAHAHHISLGTQETDRQQVRPPTQSQSKSKSKLESKFSNLISRPRDRFVQAVQIMHLKCF